MVIVNKKKVGSEIYTESNGHMSVVVITGEYESVKIEKQSQERVQEY